ncbi:hypothetical protein L3Y34_004340 [Caenorhabditis briggsae]|uniref:Protein kinase domain-containing protein n=1 Tax=Caenorhabditis briggsae TaxID=6238 RepID=A0AAE9ABL9_CAEBR|nr:hypothetical protein L3Y34_004340 [Caenorhabditis briggsae]
MTLSFNRYETIQVAGRGAFGLVVIARDNVTKKRVAIKRILIPNVSKIQLVREVSCLRCLHHRNVLKYLDCFGTADMVSIVTEEVPYTLADVINDKSRPKTEELNRWFYAQILSGIAYIHSKDIMHRDIKPENILVTLRNIIKIADFGQACFHLKDRPDEEYDENVATRWYRAPEILFGYRKYGPMVDIWAIGCILAELVRGKPIFLGRSELEQISVIFGVLGTPNETNWPKWRSMPDANKLLFEPKEPRKNWAEILRCKEVSQEFDNFLRLHLQLCCDFRPTASVLLQHSWIKKKSSLTEPVYRITRKNVEKNRRDALPPIHVFL